MRETSPEPGGIPAVFILKSLIPAAAINLALQGLADVLRNALALPCIWATVASMTRRGISSAPNSIIAAGITLWERGMENRSCSG